MSASVWIKITGCSALVVGLAGLAACTVVSTSSNTDGGLIVPGGDASASDSSKSDTGSTADTGTVKEDAGPVEDSGGGTCSVIQMVQFQNAACQTCATTKCCTSLHQCLDLSPQCKAVTFCINQCSAPDAGNPDAGGCENDCFNAAPPAAQQEFVDWQKCVFVNSCKTECT